MMRSTFCSLAAALLLAGCVTAPEPHVEIHEKLVPVPTPCVAKADVPVRPAPLARPLPDDADALLSLALAQLKRWTGYGDKADALLGACTTP